MLGQEVSPSVVFCFTFASTKHSSSYTFLQTNDLHITKDEFHEPGVSCIALTTDQRRQFVNGVLEQQSEHQYLGFNDPKGLFQFSRAGSKSSRLHAIRTAQELSSCEELIESIDAVLDLLAS